jgi:prepilin-type processing-associated H-X9-DG protein
MNGWTPPTAGYLPCLPFQVTPDWLSECDPNKAQSPHSGGIHVAMGDGSAHFLSASIQLTTWQNLCDPREGNPVGNEW